MADGQGAKEMGYTALQITLPRKTWMPLKMGGPWKFGDSYWKPSFLGANC